MDERLRTAIEASLPLKLHQATALVDRAADRYLRTAHEISYSHYVVLLIIGILGPSNQRTVANGLDVSRASITQRVTALSERGLVRVAPDELDARSVRVSLTGEGESLLDAAWRGLEQQDDGIDRGVDVLTLLRELDTLIRNARQHLGLPDAPTTADGDDR